MNRTYYRGISKKNHEFVYGYIFRPKFILYPDESILSKVGIWLIIPQFKQRENINSKSLTGKSTKSEEILFNTLGQYSEQDDSDGTKIFEDDILSFSFFGCEYTGVVKCSEGKWEIWYNSCHKFYDNGNEFQLSKVLSCDNKVKVIGNSFEYQYMENEWIKIPRPTGF